MYRNPLAEAEPALAEASYAHTVLMTHMQHLWCGMLKHNICRHAGAIGSCPIANMLLCSAGVPSAAIPAATKF